MLKCQSKGFSTLILLLKCRSKGFSTLIVLLLAKSQNLGWGFKWWRLCGPAVFDMCDFYLFLLDLDITFLSKKLWLIFVVFEKDLIFETWRLELETWNLKLEILKICNLKFWNLEFEILNLKFRMWNFELGKENFGLKIWGFGIWNWIFYL